MSSNESPLPVPPGSSESVAPAPPPATAAAPEPPRRRARRWLAGLLLLAVVLAGVAGLFGWWYESRIAVSTDNAYVVGNITPISSSVSGPVVALYVDDNMIVRPGDPIAQIDPTPFQLEVDKALADLEQARADADAADITVRLTTRDRKSLLEGATAREAEASQAVLAAEVVVQTRTRLHEKDQQVLASLKAQVPGLEALETNARDYYERFSRLAASGDIPIQDRDNREATYREATAKLKSLKSNIAAAERQVLASQLQLNEARIKLEETRKAEANSRAQVGRASAEQLQPDVASANAVSLRNKRDQAEARLRLARLNLSNTLIRAPQAGVISRRTIQLGQTLEARRTFLSIVPLDLDNVWVVANLREDQMATVRVGQPVAVTLDAVPDRTFAGWVESVSGGTGSVFSLFPPDNATGNFVRVVQRLPVRIRFADKENDGNRIRPGMSARITIDTTRHVRQGDQPW
jgi:membrane fusion protein (multidrug efflux system)